MTRHVTLDRPFSAGMVTDLPAYALGPQHSVFAQDGYSPQGVFKQRGGWEYNGTTADVNANLGGIYRAKFILNDNVRTVTATTAGAVYVHNASASGTALHVNADGAAVLPRCVYRDELILCAQDGVSPLIRYAGATTARTVSSGTPDWVQNEATITGMTLSGAADVGSYAFVYGDYLTDTYHKIIESTSTSSITLDGIVASSGDTISNFTAIDLTATGFPAVAVYNAGTITVSTSTVTGYGTKWVDTLDISLYKDAVLIIPATGNAEIGSQADATPANTSIAASLSDQSTKSNYAIMRPMPFKDAAAHKGSLWGTGVAQFPSRVYVGPPDWNISFPPGFTIPVDVTPSSGYESANANDFIMDYIDVPSAYDGDDNVAILSSPNPLLVLKRKAVYGVYGSYPNFSVDMIADGIGCIDIRSSFSADEGQFWAGENGIYWYTGGQIIDLTAGKINREWRALTRDFDYGTSDYCSMGVSQGHLVVHITTGGGTTQRTYLCDLRDQSWQSRITNFDVRYMFTSRVSGESEQLLAVSDDRQGRVLDFAPALDGSGTAKDDAGTAPVLKAWTGTGIGRNNGVDGLSKFIDVDIHTNVYDAGAAGSTVLTPYTAHGGGPSNEADATKTLTVINSDTADRIDRAPRKVGRRARFHQVRTEQTTLGTDTAATKIEVHQIDAKFRDAGEWA